jgi:RND superfamily putative drug exporter
MFEKLGRFVAAHPWLVLGLWLAGAVALARAAPPWKDRCLDDDLQQLPARCGSLAGYHLLREAFPAEAVGSRAIFVFEREQQPLTSADFRLVDEAAHALGKLAPGLSGVGAVTSHRDPLMGHRLTSSDRHCTLLIVNLDSPFLAAKTAERVHRLEEALAPVVEAHRSKHENEAEGLRVVTSGTAGMGRDLNDAAYRSVEDTTLATVILVVVILLLLYRSPLLALVPLVTIGASVWLSLRLIALLSLFPQFQVVNITQVFVVVVLYGAGTDYCLFLISRYREELRRGRRPGDALAVGLGRVGGALTASAATVICGLGMMAFAEFAKLRCTGPAIALSLGLALLASLTLTPALLRVLGMRAFWPRGLGAAAGEQSAASRGWRWLSGVLARYPARVWAGTVAVLLPLALLGWWTKPGSNIASELPRNAGGRAGLDQIARHFNPGELGPLTILLHDREPWSRPAGRQLIDALTRELGGIANVAEVRSLSRPLGEPKALPPRGQEAKLERPPLVSAFANALVGRHYLAEIPTGHVTRLEVVFRTEPFAAESEASLKESRELIQRTMDEHGASTVHALCFGITTVAADINMIQESDRLLVNVLVVVSVLGILLLVVRKPLVAVYLLVSVLFSYLVALGAAELVALAWLDTQLGVIDWKVPFFVFVVLVAIGEDYNIFLMARVMEETRQHGPWEGTLRALQHTGGTISACGLIMAGTFATLLLCQLPTLAQLGLALTIGVLLDTFVVRPVLVPAFLLMLCRKSEQAETQRIAHRPLPHLIFVPASADLQAAES